MKKSNLITRAGVFALLLICVATKVDALSSLSRACSAHEIKSYGVLGPALRLFNAIGMPDGYLDLVTRGEDDIKKYWVLESFTTDVGSFNYYLYAESRIFGRPITSFGGGSVGNGEYVKDFKSGLSSKRYNEMILLDRGRYAVASRHLMFFARAGHPEIMEYYNTMTDFLVLGYHYAIEPISKLKIDVDASSAVGCNPIGGFLQWPM